MPTEGQNNAERIAACGLRVTQNRLLILRTIEQVTRPMTAEDMFRLITGQGHSLSVGTTYRVLSDFSVAGLVVRQWIHGVGGPRAIYQAHRTPDRCPPHRLVCKICHGETPFFDEALTANITCAVGKNVLGNANQTLDILYICPECTHASERN